MGANESNVTIAEYGNWCAVSYDFLGDKSFGHFLDLEAVVAADLTRLPADTWQDSSFKVHLASTKDEVKAVREGLLNATLDRLFRSWYGNAQVRREPRLIWKSADRLVNDNTPMPPYQLTGKAKGRVLSFLANNDAQIGKHLPEFIANNGGLDWDSRIQLIRQFIEWPPDLPIAGLLGRESQVVISPVHGDLNANNILLWLKEARPFLIDFPWYQDDGHAVQDLASLEFNLKFYLLDRQELNESLHPLPALDHSPAQLPLWRELEDCLLQTPHQSAIDQWTQAHCHTDNATLCWKLLCCIRHAAVKVLGDPNPADFFAEYLPALLFYTIRAIGYDLPLPKRLLAIYSASEILRKLQFEPST